MNARFSPALVALLTLAPLAALPAQDRAESPPRILFTEEEMARFQAVAAQQAAQRESYIRPSVDEEIIKLEPYIVEGEDSLLLARLRRELEQGYRSGQRLVGLLPGDRLALLMSRRADVEFFGLGGPNAVLRSEGGVEGGRLLLNPLAVIEAFRRRSFGSVFGAPRDIQ